MSCPHKPIRLIISGCCGRMGSLIVEESLKAKWIFKLVGGLEHAAHPSLGQPIPGTEGQTVESDLRSLLPGADLLVEFSNPEASVAHAELCGDWKVPILIGTTGFREEDFVRLRNASLRIPIFWSPNMSTGILLLRRSLAQLYALIRRLGIDPAVQVSIEEVHHAQKKDAPSGTAKQLAEDLSRLSEVPLANIPIRARREGEVVGMHRVDILLGSERITLQHEALDRRVFAKGALVVARHFLEKAPPPGFYTMDDLFRSEADA